MNRRTLLLLAVLTLSAGYVDAVAFFGIGTFTANMTGNTVLVAAAIAGAFWAQVPPHIGFTLPAVSIASFSAGGIAGAWWLRGEGSARRLRRVVVAGCMAGLAIAAAFVFARSRHDDAVACVALLSTMMGLQSVVAFRAGVRGVATAYITGTLVTAFIDLAGSREERGTVAEGSANALSWLLYLVGAVAGAVALGWLADASLWPVAVAILLLVPVIS